MQNDSLNELILVEQLGKEQTCWEQQTMNKYQQ